MSLDKAIEHKKEHRKQYRGSKAIDIQAAGIMEAALGAKRTGSINSEIKDHRWRRIK